MTPTPNMMSAISASTGAMLGVGDAAVHRSDPKRESWQARPSTLSCDIAHAASREDRRFPCKERGGARASVCQRRRVAPDRRRDPPPVSPDQCLLLTWKQATSYCETAFAPPCSAEGVPSLPA